MGIFARVVETYDKGKLREVIAMSYRCRGRVFWVGLVVFAWFGLIFFAEGASEKKASPPAAPGYGTRLEVVIAIKTGRLKLLTPAVPLPAGVELIEDIEYGKVGERSLKLDLYKPKKMEQLVPGLIFIHGGGWSGGDKKVYRLHASRYASRGYVSVSVAYRFSGEAAFPAAVEDVKCAVRWMRAEGARYGIDPDKIAVLGGSAGGHLAMMAGYSWDVKELEGKGGHEGVSSKVQAVVNLYGPSDLTVPFAQKSPLVWKFLGGKRYKEDPELYAKASPMYYLTKGDPPTLILHGTLDQIVPIEQSDALAKKLKKLGISYTYDRLKGWPHTMDAAEPAFNRCVFFIDEFLDEHVSLPKEEKP